MIRPTRLVLLPGFGFSPDAMKPIGTFLARRFDLPDSAIESIDLLSPEMRMDFRAALTRRVDAHTGVVGFSLGGLLALTLTGPCWKRWLLASTPHFLAEPDWPGISPAFFQDFAYLFETSPTRGFRQFQRLQSPGLNRPRPFLHATMLDSPDWASWLPVLRTLDGRSLPPPVRTSFVLGGKDALLPPTLADALKRLWPTVDVQILPAHGHCFLDVPEEIPWN